MAFSKFTEPSLDVGKNNVTTVGVGMRTRWNIGTSRGWQTTTMWERNERGCVTNLIETLLDRTLSTFGHVHDV